ncbi:autotransporter domain-containing protein [uncultured Pseudodesulfovibrio sp.]|uniref:autotransporter family protein n=1 Tax=uncultured Pseudodesulfovibrio sp. TaxID=2035858 RepID=UPI0029C8202D|nr:autotransporter domain-containing protein [uncultured Pseudodesulfovibrio sp.]
MKFLKLHRSRAFLCFAVILLCSVSLLSISARAAENTGTVTRPLVGNWINSGNVILSGGGVAGAMYTDGIGQNLVNTAEGYIKTPFGDEHGMTALHANSILSNSGIIDTYGNGSNGMYMKVASTGYNYGTITATNDLRGIGMRAEAASTAINYGTIINNEQGRGMSADASTIENRGSVFTRLAGAYGMHGESSSTVTNRGTITTLGGNAYGLSGIDSILTNSGTITNSDAPGLVGGRSIMNNSGTITVQGATTGAIWTTASTLTNSGTIAGYGLGGRAIVASTNSQIYLKTGTTILAGNVHDLDGTNALYLVGSGTVNFNITGNWAEIHKAEVGTWTLTQNVVAQKISLDDGTLALNSGVRLSGSTYNQAAGSTLAVNLNGDGTVPVTVTGLATVAGKLVVDVDGKNMVGDQTIIAAGSVAGNFDSVVSLNPNFSLSTRVDGTDVKLSTPYAPKWDNTALSMTSILASNMAFIQVPTARSQTLLTANDREEEDEYVMVASNGPLVDLVSQKPSKEQRYGVYAKPMFSISERDAFGSALGYDATMVGLEVGADTFVSDNLLLGAFAGYAATGIDFKGNAFAENDTEDQSIYVLGAYGGYRLNDWSFTDTLSFSYGQHDSKRNAGLGETAKGDYNSQLIGNQFLASYRGIGNDTWTLAPELGLNTSCFYRGSFSETDATNAATYDSLGALFIESEVGMRLSGNIVTESATFLPYVKLNWSHDLNGNDITVRQTLGATSAQVTQENDDDNLSLSLGTSIRKGNTSFNLAYTGEASQHSRSHSLSAIARYEF